MKDCIGHIRDIVWCWVCYWHQLPEPVLLKMRQTAISFFTPGIWTIHTLMLYLGAQKYNKWIKAMISFVQTVPDSHILTRYCLIITRD